MKSLHSCPRNKTWTHNEWLSRTSWPSGQLGWPWAVGRAFALYVRNRVLVMPGEVFENLVRSSTWKLSNNSDSSDQLKSDISLWSTLWIKWPLATNIDRVASFYISCYLQINHSSVRVDSDPRSCSQWWVSTILNDVQQTVEVFVNMMTNATDSKPFIPWLRPSSATWIYTVEAYQQGWSSCTVFRDFIMVI